MFHPSTGIFAGASRHVESRVGRMRCRLWPGLFTPPIRKSPEFQCFSLREQLQLKSLATALRVGARLQRGA